MKRSFIKIILPALFLGSTVSNSFAQDDDAIYGDIRKTPKVEETIVDSVSPLDGYSTVDDYYQDGRANSQQNSNQASSSTYTDPSGNNITNNYYGDYYEDNNDYDYAARINRFHRPIYSYGYYDPFYTNMYYYNYDPFYWGTSIYIGYRPNFWYGWNSMGWGWNGGWGWNDPFVYSPACYGGYGFGYGGGYWNGYNNGYWNGYHDGLAYGGYYNTYDQNSGIYYGPRGAQGSAGSIGSGYRNPSVVTAYNEAAKAGKVSHANVGNVLQTADARPVRATVDGKETRNISTLPEPARQAGQVSREPSSTRIITESNRERVDQSRTIAPSRENPYPSGTVGRNPGTTDRNVAPSVERNRTYVPAQPRDRSSSNQPANTYQRGADQSRNYSGQRPSENSGNISRDIQRQQPNSNQQPSRSGFDSRNGNQYSRPSNAQPNNNQAPPSRNYQPSRETPSRSVQPSREASPAPSRESSKPNVSAPSRSSSPSFSPGSGNRGGSGSSPSRQSSGSRSGRP